MHIFELIEPTVQARTYPGTFQPKHGTGYQKRPGHIESGSFSIVRDDPKNPHSVIKTARGPKETEIDGFWVYVDYLIKLKLRKNPYFPRIYQKKTFSDKEKKEIKRINMERLHDIKTISQDEGIFLYRKTFGEDVDKFILDDFTDRIEIEVEEKKVQGDKNKYDNHYLRAASILNKIASDNGLVLDIWGENVMIRRGAHGVQIVFTDPFSHKLGPPARKN